MRGPDEGSADPRNIASFWEAALGWRRTFDEVDQVCVEPPEGSPEDGVAPDILFLKVPEPKAVKNRIHLDVFVGADNVTAEAAKLIERDATHLHDGQEGPPRWITLSDPEGNEFCVS